MTNKHMKHKPISTESKLFGEREPCCEIDVILGVY